MIDLRQWERELLDLRAGTHIVAGMVSLLLSPLVGEAAFHLLGDAATLPAVYWCWLSSVLNLLLASRQSLNPRYWSILGTAPVRGYNPPPANSVRPQPPPPAPPAPRRTDGLRRSVILGATGPIFIGPRAEDGTTEVHWRRLG